MAKRDEEKVVNPYTVLYWFVTQKEKELSDCLPACFISPSFLCENRKSGEEEIRKKSDREKRDYNNLYSSRSYGYTE